MFESRPSSRGVSRNSFCKYLRIKDVMRRPSRRGVSRNIGDYDDNICYG